MAQELEARMIVQVVDVALGAGEEIVDADDLVALRKQPVDQVRAEKPSAARHQNALAAFIESRHRISLKATSVKTSLASNEPIPWARLC